MSNTETSNALIEEAYAKKLETTPHVVIDLPSKGVVYEPSNPASKGQLRLAYMKGKHENILLSPALMRNGKLFDVLLNDLVLDRGFDAETLITSDKMYLLISARGMSIGFDYNLENFMCEECELVTPRLSLSLENIEDVPVSITPDVKNKNEFSYKVPKTNDTMTFKILTSKDEKELVEKMTRLRNVPNKNGNGYEPLVSYGIASLTLSINGNSELSFGQKVDYIENLPIMTVKQIQTFLQDKSGNIEPYIKHSCSNCGHETDIKIQVGLPFFFPK